MASPQQQPPVGPRPPSPPAARPPAPPAVPPPPKTSYRALHQAATNAMAWLEPLLALRDALGAAADAEGYVATAQGHVQALDAEATRRRGALDELNAKITGMEATLATRLAEAKESAAEARRAIAAEVAAQREAAALATRAIAEGVQAAERAAAETRTKLADEIARLHGIVQALDHRRATAEEALDKLAAVTDKVAAATRGG